MCHNRFIILYVILLYIITHMDHNYIIYNIHIDSININNQAITEPGFQNKIISNYKQTDARSLHEYDYILPPSPDTLRRFKSLPSLPPPIPPNHPPSHAQQLPKKNKLKFKNIFNFCKCCK